MLIFHEDEINRNSLLDSICRMKFFSLLGSKLLVVMMPRNWPKHEYWCNILTCTIFHHLMLANVNTCPIPVCPLGCTVHAKLCTVQTSPEASSNGYSTCVRPSCVLENGGLLECYTSYLYKWNFEINLFVLFSCSCSLHPEEILAVCDCSSCFPLKKMIIIRTKLPPILKMISW